MRFGGHETFAIREGWLHKGMELLITDPERLNDAYASDLLGVGRNMAKSIRHWLIATQLSADILDRGTRRRVGIEPTQLARTIHAQDPYFLESGTWWALHVNLVNNPEHAMSWWWFFNNFLQTRFERAAVVEGLRRYLVLHDEKTPRLKTLQRDVACLLATYSREIPPSICDPEDATESPFTELGLLTHFRESGAFGREPATIATVPLELIPYALLTADSKLAKQGGEIEVPVREAFLQIGGPGRCFNFELESFYEACVEAEAMLGKGRFRVVSLAGERSLQFEGGVREQWLQSYYDRVLGRAAA